MATINKITLPNGDSYDIEDTSAVKGVKGNSESSYRTGNVNITSDNIGAIPASVSGNTQKLIRPNYLNGLNDNTLDAKINTLRANRLAFLPADQIIIEKTTDGGTTWVDAGIADSTKVGLFSETRAGVYIPLLNGVKNINCGLRITITGMKYNVPSGTAETSKYNYWNSNYIASTERYNQLKEMYFWVSGNSDTISVKVERATGAKSTTWNTIFENNNYGMTGWSGNDYIRFNQGVFGGGTNQTGNYWNYRLTFFTRGPNGSTTLSGTNTTSAQAIQEIRGYGDSWWAAGNEYAANDKIYTHDYLKNVTFPAKVTATSFSGSLTGNVTGNVVGNISGSAGTAGEFTSAKSVTLTGDVTGTASSKGGWSIATTVADDSHNHTAATLSGVALSTDVLTKTNTTSYTPSANYHPATKKYVDDAVAPEVFVVNFTSASGNTYTADKTYSEITAAYNAGKIVYGKDPYRVYILSYGNDGYVFQSLGFESTEEGFLDSYYIYYTNNVWTSGVYDFLNFPTLNLSGNTIQLKQNNVTISTVDVPWLAGTEAITWSGSGSNKTASPVIDCTTKDLYIKIPYISGASQLSSTATDGGDVLAVRCRLYSDANKTNFVGYYKFETGEISSSNSWTWANVACVKFGKKTLVAPHGYYVQLYTSNTASAFNSNSQCTTYLNTYATEAFLVI